MLATKLVEEKKEVEKKLNETQERHSKIARIFFDKKRELNEEIERLNNLVSNLEKVPDEQFKAQVS